MDRVEHRDLNRLVGVDERVREPLCSALLSSEICAAARSGAESYAQPPRRRRRTGSVRRLPPMLLNYRRATMLSYDGEASTLILPRDAGGDSRANARSIQARAETAKLDAADATASAVLSSETVVRGMRWPSSPCGARERPPLSAAAQSLEVAPRCSALVQRPSPSPCRYNRRRRSDLLSTSLYSQRSNRHIEASPARLRRRGK